MRVATLLPLVGAVLSLTACNGTPELAPKAQETTPKAQETSAPAIPQPPPAPLAAPALTVVPVKLVATSPTVAPGQENDVDFKTLEVIADGTIMKDGKPSGLKIMADRVEGPAGKAVVKVAPDGALTFTGGLIDPLAGKITANGVSLDGGATIVIDDDGTVALTGPDGKALPLAAKFASLAPNGKHTAALLVAINAYTRRISGGRPSAAAAKK